MKVEIALVEGGFLNLLSVVYMVNVSPAAIAVVNPSIFKMSN